MALSLGEADPAKWRKPWLALPLSGWCLLMVRCAVGSAEQSWATWGDAVLLLLCSVGGIISAASGMFCLGRKCGLRVLGLCHQHQSMAGFQSEWQP